ncbi:MAG TPA: hypothetical protein VL200_10630 [Lacunisphaera sp.]|nr:hypothetical protein [Lacunisphaera sp.]
MIKTVTRAGFALLAALVVAGCTSSPMSRIDANRALYESWPFDIQEAVLNGKIVAGMNAEQVRMTLGEPSEITNRNGRKGPEEVWVYRTGGGLGSNAVGNVLRNTTIGLGGGLGPVGIGTGANLGTLGVGGGSEPVEDDHEVVFQDGVVVRSDAGK